jgi:pimeloyl-ACP methyl ester carboxylesterase/DNA-binding CsgD family transcriptional regulator
MSNFYALLERHSAKGSPLEVWIEDPEGLVNAAKSDGAIFDEAIERAARLTSPHASILREESIAAAALSIDGELVAIDSRFALWFGPDVIDKKIVARVGAEKSSERALHLDEEDRPALFAYAYVDIARSWLLPREIQEAISQNLASVVVLGVAPSRAHRLQREAARAFGLNGIEAKVVAALVDTGKLPEAAAQAQVSYSTARDAISSALKRTGARRQADLVGKLLALSAGSWRRSNDSATILIDAFGLTLRQANIASRLADGLTRSQTAKALGLSNAIVKDDLTKIFAALHVSTATDLARIVTETSALAALTSVTYGEFSSPREGIEPLQFIERSETRGGGWIAISDYGPRHGDPLIVMHSGATSRHVPRSLVKALQLAGFRPLAIDRPGFGLTTMAPLDDGKKCPFENASEDTLTVCEALGLGRVDLLLRGNGRGVYHLCKQAPNLVGQIVALNPDTPYHLDTKRDGILGAVKESVALRPGAISTITRLLLGRADLRLIERAIRATLKKSPSDLAVFDDPNEVIDYARSVRMLAAGNIEGLIAEQTAHMTPWNPEPLNNGLNWTFLCGDADPLYDFNQSLKYWQGFLPNCRFALVPNAGRFMHLSHTDIVISALRGRLP